MVALHPTPLEYIRSCTASDAAQRLALGQALLSVKHQRLYRSLGFERFEAFLDSPQCPCGHTVARHAMRLAERTELHGALGLGVGRLTELMRLSPQQVRRLLAEGTPAGPLAGLSVRALRRHVLGVLSTEGACTQAAFDRPEQIAALVDGWADPLRERLLDALLTRQFGQDLRRVRGLLTRHSAAARVEIAPYFPETRRGVPQRWVALTTHLEALERLLGGEPAAVAPLIHRLGRSLEEWERAVFYLELCRRDPERFARLKRTGTACAAVERIFNGRDWQFGAERAQLTAQLARGRQADAGRIRPFWRQLYREVSPPAEFRSFLGSLEATVAAHCLQVDCGDLYRAEYVLVALRARPAQLFWQIAASQLAVSSIRLHWQEGGRPRERLISLAADAA